MGDAGGPNETPRRSEPVPEATRVQDEPSKCSVVPSFPTAQPLFDAKITTPFRLSVVEADGFVRAADNGRATKSKSTNKNTLIIGRKSYGYTSSQSLMGIASARIIASQRLLCHARFFHDLMFAIAQPVQNNESERPGNSRLEGKPNR